MFSYGAAVIVHTKSYQVTAKISDSFINNSNYSDMKALYSLPLISRRVLKMEWMKHSWGSLNKAFPSKSKLNYKNIRWFIHYFTF